MTTISEIRPSPIAGRWYPGDPTDLVEEVNANLKSAETPPLEGQVVGLIAPHAGYRYSGRTAGYAFKTVMGAEFDIVAIVSPLHDYHPGEILISGHKAYATPLGQLEIDRKAVEAFKHHLEEMGGPAPQEVVYDQEHSLEIELPFLQTALAGGFKILPLMVRSRSALVCRITGQALAAALNDRSALLVASSDLSHFYPETRANDFDDEMLRLISEFSPEKVLQADAGGSAFACGAGAIAAVLWAAREMGADQVKVLHHSTSAAETGDHSSVVGYGAAAILRST